MRLPHPSFTSRATESSPQSFITCRLSFKPQAPMRNTPDRGPSSKKVQQGESSNVTSKSTSETNSLHRILLPNLKQISYTMAPKQQRVIVQKADPRRSAPKGYFSSAYSTLTSPENASVVRSIAVFGVCFPLLSALHLADFMLRG
jgi:hypothetical protein